MAGAQYHVVEHCLGLFAPLGHVRARHFTVPDDAVDSPAAMQPWARLALEAALRAAAHRPARPVKARSKSQPASRRARKG